MSCVWYQWGLLSWDPVGNWGQLDHVQSTCRRLIPPRRLSHFSPLIVIRVMSLMTVKNVLSIWGQVDSGISYGSSGALSDQKTLAHCSYV